MKDVPMPDLSPMVRGGYSTLISEQHLISVAHNVGYDGVDFGMGGEIQTNIVLNIKSSNVITIKMIVRTVI